MNQHIRKDIHTIDTRFTWSGQKAKDFIDLAKEEYGSPLPYGAIRQLIRLACAKFVEANKNRLAQLIGEIHTGELEAGIEARRKERNNERKLIRDV